MFKIHADEIYYYKMLDELCNTEIKWNLEDLKETILDPIDWNSSILSLKKVIFNPPATIAFWNDGTKTVVKCMAGDIYDPYAGLALCYSKKLLGRKFHKTFKKHCESYETEAIKTLLNESIIDPEVTYDNETN